jgi:hypothetical protein
MCDRMCRVGCVKASGMSTSSWKNVYAFLSQGRLVNVQKGVIKIGKSADVIYERPLNKRQMRGKGVKEIVKSATLTCFSNQINT